MTRPEVRRPLAVLTALSVLAACASPRAVAPINDLGSSYEPAPDEVRLWEDVRVEERKFRREAPFYDDPLLDDYLNDIAAAIETEGMAQQETIQLRVLVLEDPALNAFAYPTGSIYIHTGLLARLENEDQLAGILAHEMTHVDERHLLKHRRSANRKALGYALASLGASILIASEAGHEVSEGHYGKAARIATIADIFVGLGLQLAFIAAINGYGRDLERAADAGAIRAMQRNGYDPAELERVFDLLADDHGDSRRMENFFFGSHPRLAERKEDTRALIAAAPAQAEPVPRPEGDRFERRLRSVLKDDARMNIAAGRYRLARDELDRALALLPDDPEALHLKGELYLAWARDRKDPRKSAELREEAREAFLLALEADAMHAPSFRELGLLYFRDGERGLACEAFRTYVSLDPDAEDAARIRDYVREVEAEGLCPEESP